MDFDIHLEGSWHRCATVTLEDATQASRRERVLLRYEADYAVERLGASDHRALAVRAPVDLGVRTLPHWPSFLIDLLPQGAARKRLERLDAGALTEWALLERGGVNPVGNLRVRPHAPYAARIHPGFELREMTSRGDAFIDYANEVGATVAGATDTQGDAPKFWIVQDEKGRWHPDSGEVGAIARRFALLKFPVPEAGLRAEEILRNEAAYQRVAARLGLRVTETLPEFIDGALLIPRFDRRSVRGTEIRLGVESLYSVAGVLDSAHAPLAHHAALIALAGCLTDLGTEIGEYVRRDLLNLALGNRDNHGRNTAILKDTDGSMRLAPLFDLGPSFLDARAIARVMRWPGEALGSTGSDWNHVLENLAVFFEEEARPGESHLLLVARAMRSFVRELKQLPELMRDCGVDQSIIELRRPQIEQLARTLDGVRLS
jgi:serine/threonine-protein kinase HipA